MALFSHLMHTEITEAELKKNIVHVLSTGEYLAPHAKDLDDYIQPEIQNFIQCFHSSSNEDVVIRPATSLLNDALYPDKKKAAAYVNERKIDKAHFYKGLDVFATGATAQRLDGKKQDYTFFYNTSSQYEPFTLLHSFYHELSHLVELKKGYKKHPKDIIDEKDDTIETTKSEIYANTMANTILMVKALQTKNPETIAKVKQEVLFYSSYMSNALINSGLGVAYCDWGATSKIIPDLEKNGISSFVKKDGQLNWNTIHTYVVKKIEEMGYTPEKCIDAKEKIHPIFKKLRDSGAGLSKIVNVAKQMTSKENNVLNDFIEAQTYYQTSEINPIKRLALFYSSLYLSSTRKNVLLSERYDDFPNIQRYRKIYELSQRKHMLLNFAQKAKQFLQNPFSFFSKNR